MRALPPLRCYTFDDKYAARRRAMPDGLDGLICRGILPGARLLRAVESDHDETILGCGALDCFNLAAANEVMGVVRLQRVRNLGAIFRERCGVMDVDFRDDVARRGLRLLRMNGHPGHTDDYAGKHRQYQFVIRFHGFFPLGISAITIRWYPTGYLRKMLHHSASMRKGLELAHSIARSERASVYARNLTNPAAQKQP